jgi:hypothetical protein
MGLNLDTSDNKHFHEEEIIIMRDEKVQEITGQRDLEMEKEGKKALWKTDIFTIEELRG